MRGILLNQASHNGESLKEILEYYCFDRYCVDSGPFEFSHIVSLHYYGLINEMKSYGNTDDDDDHPFPSCNYLLSGHVEFLHEAWLNGVFGISKRLLNLFS